MYVKQYFDCDQNNIADCVLIVVDRKASVIFIAESNYVSRHLSVIHT